MVKIKCYSYITYTFTKVTNYYLNFVRELERFAIRRGLFKSALLVRIFNNSLIKLNGKSKLLSEDMKLIKLYASVELDLILKDLLGLKYKKLNFFATDTKIIELISHLEKYDCYSGLYNLMEKEILIVGPGVINHEDILNHNLEILLDPNLHMVEFKPNIDYVIVLNKTNTERYYQLILHHVANTQIKAILTKKWFPKFDNFQKIQILNSNYLTNLAPTSGTPNLLPIMLYIVNFWNPKRVQIIGCDLYLSDSRYRADVKPVDLINKLNSKQYFLDSLSLHNPYAQLTHVKLIASFFRNNGIDFPSNLPNVRYFEMASIYNKRKQV